MNKTRLSNDQNNNLRLFNQILTVYKEVYSSQNKGKAVMMLSQWKINCKTTFLLYLIWIYSIQTHYFN